VAYQFQQKWTISNDHKNCMSMWWDLPLVAKTRKDEAGTAHPIGPKMEMIESE
jgi:hypothetical protein